MQGFLVHSGFASVCPDVASSTKPWTWSPPFSTPSDARVTMYRITACDYLISYLLLPTRRVPA